MKTTMQQKQVVILGGGYAGVNAALRLRVRDKAVNITLVNDGAKFIERIRNHQAAAGQTLKEYNLREILGRGTTLVEARAERIDTAGKKVLVKDKHGTMALGYDILIYALGSATPAYDASGMYNVAARGDASALENALRAEPEKPVVVVGAGLTGLELATELREKWPTRKITLWDRQQPGGHLSEKGRHYLTATLAEMRIDFAIFKDDPFADAAFARSNIAINCAGFRSPELAKKSKLAVDEKNRILVNEYLQAEAHPHIFAAGDAAAYPFGTENIAYGGCATAMPMGTYLGEAVHAALAGKDLPEFRYGFTFQCISLGRRDGIIQFLDKRTGAANARVLTGKRAAVFKELICKATVLLPRWESKTRWPFYTWRKTRLVKRINASSSSIF
jgi:NADH dehydrogenase